jgi:hypothetical protein
MAASDRSLRAWVLASLSEGIGRSVRVVGSVQRCARDTSSPPFPNVEHRRDLAPPSDVRQCSVSVESAPGKAICGTRAIPIEQEVPWPDSV